MFFMLKIVNAGTVGCENQPTLLKVTCTTQFSSIFEMRNVFCHKLQAMEQHDMKR